MFDLTGRTAIVTGGTSGIGKGVCRALLDAGARVVTGSRTPEKVDAARAELATGRGADRLLLRHMDVAEPGSFDAALAAAAERFGRVDILVNNAGSNLKKPTLDVDEAEHRRLFDVNYFGPFAASQAFCRQVMRQNETACGAAAPADASNRIGSAGFGGCIINVCSVTSFVALSEVTAYAATKGALLALTRQLAVEWPRLYGIRVNAIAPGFIPADQNRAILKSGDRGRRILENLPLQRFGSPDEIAGAVIFLAAPAARYVNGECISIDGGFMIHGVSEAEPRDET
ncbi:MAG: glucose 1-dehydrogenase [Planctomycetes bacterium]|jgi:NAD(P)-dependent dehydrogenase (short-subunit alcohol dehydrogenase family)|nr:glucose 1-dehydrogenase [Planctomycetota bacterium]